jgi:soluble lytic murein transglycosylase-like protein
MRKTSLTATLSGLRACVATALLASLAACASSGKHVEAVNEAAQYQAHASGNYSVPGDPADPWGPYVTEASKRFDVPERWIREVMRQESGGQMFHNGGLTTSPVGAMGLMQVMPGTYDMLRNQYSLGDDPYDPHNNILAGTAYIRQMYDLYGSPGFLAAYNAGPARVDDYLTKKSRSACRNKTLCCIDRALYPRYLSQQPVSGGSIRI